jgi:putative chitinase
MKIRDIVLEGGWASAKTQETVVTPKVLDKVVKMLKNEVEPRMNQWLSDRGIPAIQFGRPVGSGTYYQRHLKTQPDKRYGDIDIQFIIPRIADKSNNENKQFYYDLAKSYGQQSGSYESENGKNIIVKIGANKYAQIDLVSIFGELVRWSDVFSPPEGVKGVLSASLYSSLGEALNLSISDLGVQVKLSNGQIVPFSKQKDVETATITTIPERWAVDIAKYFKCSKLDPLLARYPGLGDEVTIEQLIGSIVGLARTLELNNRLSASGIPHASAEDLLKRIQEIYLGKIQKVVNSSKFDKAASPEAQQLAQETKELLKSKGQAIAGLLTSTLTEGFKSNLARLGLIGGLAMGAAHYGKDLNLPSKDQIFGKPAAIQDYPDVPPELQVPKKKIDPVIQFLHSLEPNNLRDLLVDTAVTAGMKGLELAQFIAQTHHETGAFTKLIEIGSERQITRNYDIRHNPELARSLGNTRPGDGWKYRGRGFIQLTGKANYTAASKSLFGDDRLVNNPELASDPIIAANIALWYWGWRVQPRVNNFENTTEVTKPINPSLNGLTQRKQLFNFYRGDKES